MRTLLLVLAAAAALLAAAPAGAATRFETPSGNIGCAISKEGVRCDIGKRYWDPPRKPAWCSVDWGNGLEVGRRGTGRMVCAGDTVLGAKRVVGYRKSIRRGRFRCTVRRNGVRCANLRNDHGFRLSRSSARWY